MTTLPPIAAATEAMLADEPPVWVPLCTPNYFVCRYAFHPPGYRKHDSGRNLAPLPADATLADIARSLRDAGVSLRPDPERPDDRGFRIVRWLKATGDFVLKNEPVAVVDGSRARSNSVLRGLNLPDPVIYAPESGKLVWRHPSTEPHRLFGLIQSTNELVHANVRYRIRSDLVPMIEAIVARLQGRPVAWRRSFGLFDKAGRGYLEGLGSSGLKAGLRLMSGPESLLRHCHRLGADNPSPDRFAPGWDKATDFEKKELLKIYVEPARARYDRAWKAAVDDLRQSRADVALMGFAFALPP